MKHIDKSFLEVIWQVLARKIGYEVMIKICQNIIKDTDKNDKFSQYLTFLFYKSFYESQNKIASECREELIKKSIMTLYRGVITYQPAENDYDIKNLENKIQSLSFQLKDINKIKQKNQQIFALNTIEEVLTELSQLNDLSLRKTQEYLDLLIEKAEKDCSVNIYKEALRDKSKGLGKVLYETFFVEVENNDELSSMFSADLLPLKNINDVETDDSSTHHIVEKSDGKLFTAPVKHIPIKSGTSWKKLIYGKKAAYDIQDYKSSPAQQELTSDLSPENLEQALEAIGDSDSDLSRAKKLGELAPSLSPEMLKQALQTACNIESELWRATALGELAPHLSKQLLKRAFYTACDIKSELWRVKALSNLAPHLTPRLLEQALEVAHGIKSEYNRKRALEELKPHLSSKE